MSRLLSKNISLLKEQTVWMWHGIASPIPADCDLLMESPVKFSELYRHKHNMEILKEQNNGRGYGCDDGRAC